MKGRLCLLSLSLCYIMGTVKCSIDSNKNPENKWQPVQQSGIGPNPAGMPTRLGPEPVAMLKPQESETRRMRLLDGVWQFRLSPRLDPNMGFREQWWKEPLEQTGNVISMPVPSSYNDITQNADIRDHVGWVWYSTRFWVPTGWLAENKRIVLRFGGVHYTAKVYVNGLSAFNHLGGHLPFEGEIGSKLLEMEENFVVVAVSNVLSNDTIPQGQITWHNDTSLYPPGFFTLDYTFDFYNYAGIHRPVILYSTPGAYIKDITITTEVEGDVGIVNFVVTMAAKGLFMKMTCDVSIYNSSGNKVAKQKSASGTFRISGAKLWWPYLMNNNPGYLYTLKVECNNGHQVDIYRQKFGIRHLQWDSKGITINGRPIYIRGVNKHEDADIRGKGVDLPTITKDFNLIKWLGANCFRTSHYPYAEEIMDFADEQGIMVIDETPGVNLEGFNNDILLNHHLDVLNVLIARDKNRPSVIMWSMTNEAKTEEHSAHDYYNDIINFTRQRDGTRPVTAVLNTSPDTDQVAMLLDVICFNHYAGWYSDTGDLNVIQKMTVALYSAWNEKFSKPVVVSEYGAGAISGLHMDPGVAFSEDYQVELIMRFIQAFKEMRERGFLLGEMIWNFADFMTQQQYTRVVGNRKGIFTRERQPKPAAHLLRSHYWDLAKTVDNYTESQPLYMWFTDVHDL